MKKSKLTIFLLSGLLCAGSLMISTKTYAQTEKQYTLDNGVYNINAFSEPGMRLDVTAGGTYSGTNAELWSANDSNAQKYYFAKQSNGNYVITAECSGKALAAASSDSGANVTFETCDGSKLQQWQLIKNSDDSIAVKSAAGDVYLDINGGNMEEGTNIQVWEETGSVAQRFSFKKAESKQTLGDGIFTISSYLNDDMRLDVNREAYGSGVNLQLWSANDSNAQKFAVQYIGNGSYTLTPLCSGMRLDVNGASGSEGANVQQWEDNNGSAQKWKIESVGNGYYRLKAECSGLYMDVNWADASNGTNIQQWSANTSGAQYFRFDNTEYTQTVKDGYYKLNSGIADNYFVDIAGGSEDWGANVDVWTYNDTNAEKFQLTYLGNGEYKIGCVCSGLVLDVEDGGSENGTNIRQWPYNGSASQRWKIYHAEDGSYYFQSVVNGLMLDVNGAVAYEGNNVQAWEFTGSAAQKYWLHDTTPVFTGWTTLNGRKYYYNGNGDLSSKIGIDVSVYQQNIDWQAVKDDGIEFAIIRVGYGDDFDYQDDNKAKRNMDECERLGIPYGVYLYSYATCDDQAYSELNHILRLIDGRNPEMGVYIDIEDTNTYIKHGVDPYSADGREKITRWTKIITGGIANAGYKAGVYANYNYYNNILYRDQLSGIKWLAYYGKNDPYQDYTCPDGPWAIWQYTSKGTVNGITGYVDMNAWIY